jgi:hypothetical protein
MALSKPLIKHGCWSGSQGIAALESAHGGACSPMVERSPDELLTAGAVDVLARPDA